jgi:DNA-binding transcriptional regulator YhcF (GntR family)
MRFWFVHSGDVPIREQIVTQITLGILSHELAPGEKLPSTRELARRFNFHPNTVSAAYRELESDGWVESRRGSGVFVRRLRRVAEMSEKYSAGQAYDHVFANFLRSTRKMGIPQSEVMIRLRRWLDAPQTTCFLLMEESQPLIDILLTEIRQAIEAPISACAPDDPGLSEKLVGAAVLALPCTAAAASALLPSGSELITLQVRSAAASLTVWLPAPFDALIGVASAWPQFLEIAHTMLIAAGFSADALLFRDAATDGWMEGLEQTAAVVCDSFTAARLPRGVRTIVYPLLTDASLEELRQRSRAMVPAEA